MSNLIDALTLAVIAEETENVLQSHLEYHYQQSFSMSDFRQKLVTYVMSRIYNTYPVIEDVKPVSKPKFVCYYSQQKIQIQTLIHQGIQHILQQKLDWASHHISEEVELGYAPSHWFG